jgi:hypothetical protein
MANIIKHKRSSATGAVPTPADLALGELAINTTDGRLFTKKTDGSVVDLTTTGGVDGGELQYDQLRQGLMAFWLFDQNSMRVDDVSGNNVTLYEGFSEQTVSGFDGALRLAKRNFYYANNAFVGHKTLAFWVKTDTRFKGAYNEGITYNPGDMVAISGQLWRMHTFIGAAGYMPEPAHWTLLGAAASEYPLLSVANFGAANQARIYFAPDGKLTWLPKIGTTNVTAATATELPYAAWRHVAFVYDAAQNYLRVYENGAQTVAVSVSGAAPSDAAAKFMLGWSNVVAVDIDCFGVWSRALSAAEVQTLYGGGSNAYVIPAIPPADINYEEFVTLNIAGAINTITATISGNTNTLYPAFNSAIRDYGILTSSVSAGTAVTYTVTINGVAYPGASVVGKLIRITNGTENYYVRLLPSDMPLGTVTTAPQAGYVPGYYITTSRRDINVNNYNIVYDENGVPVWYVQNAGTPHLAQHGNDRNKIGVSRNGTGTRFSMTLTEDAIETKEFSFLPTQRNGNTYQYNFGNHEFLEVKSPPSARGNVIYNTFVAQPANGSQALTDKAYGVYIQEQTPQNTIGWEWWTSDRFDQTTLARNASFFHMNSVDIHPVTGDMLLSCRQCSAIVCVDRATKDVKWVIQGESQPWGGIQQTANQYTLDNAKWLTLEGEPELEGYQYLGPEGQHHARWAVNVDPLTPGNAVVAIFDNQAGFFPGSTNSPKTVTALVQDGTTVTGTATAHGFTTGSYVKVVGANEAVFNGIFQVTVVNSSTFTYTVAESGTATATGTAITAVRALTYWPHSANSPAARGVIYEIDLVNNTAIHRASVFAPNGTSGYLGSYQIALHDNGSYSHVLNFTQQHPPLVEYGDEGDGASPTGVIFAVDFPGDLYRITKVSKNYFDINYLRATAGLPITVVS